MSLLLGFPTAQDGLSAYEIAVNNGFIGTEAQWLASLQGATGATGATGAQGAQGATGAQGAQGATGAAAVNPILNIEDLNSAVAFTQASWPYTYLGTAKPLMLTVVCTAFGGYNTGTYFNATWKNAQGVIIKGPLLIYGNNISAGTDGGSSMSNAGICNLPFIAGTKTILIERFGNVNGGTITQLSVLTQTI